MPLIATTHADISRLLERAGFRVLETADPVDAARRADLVVLPYVNRPISGVEWCQRLRQQSPDLPIVMVTRSPHEITAALEAGASDVLRQPLRHDVMAARLRGWLAAGQNHNPAGLSEGPRDYPDRILDALPDPVVVVDPDGLVVLVNRATEILTGYRASDLVSRANLGELFASPSEADRLLTELRRAPDQELTERALQLRTRQGERIPMRASAGLIRSASGRVLGAVALLRDDTTRESLSERLATATEQLVAAEKRAESVKAASAAAHELNQPLTSVMGILEMLMIRPEMSRDSRDKLDRAYAQLERMAEIARGLARLTTPPTSPRRGSGR